MALDRLSNSEGSNGEKFHAIVEVTLAQESLKKASKDFDSLVKGMETIIKEMAQKASQSVAEMYKTMGDKTLFHRIKDQFGEALTIDENVFNSVNVFAKALENLIEEENKLLPATKQVKVTLQDMGIAGAKGIDDLVDSMMNLSRADMGDIVADFEDMKDKIKQVFYDLVVTTDKSITELSKTLGKPMIADIARFQLGPEFEAGKFEKVTILKAIQAALNDVIKSEKEYQQAVDKTIEIEGKWRDQRQQADVANILQKEQKSTSLLETILGNVREKFGDVDNVASTFFGVTLANVGVMAIQKVGEMFKKAFQEIIKFIKEGIDLAVKFDKAIFNLQASIRAMQRSGSEITLEGMTAQLEKLSETYTTFSSADLVAGTSKATTMLRQMGVTVSDLNSFLDETIKLAVLSGQTFEDTAEDIAIAVTTGYSRTAKRLGLAYGPAQLQVVSMDMYERSYNLLSLADRAKVSMELIRREMTAYGLDFETYAKSYSGMLDSANAELENSKKLLGDYLLPYWSGLMRILAEFVGYLTSMPYKMVAAFITPIIAFQDELITTKDLIASFAAFTPSAQFTSVFGLSDLSISTLKNSTPEEIKQYRDNVAELEEILRDEAKLKKYVEDMWEQTGTTPTTEEARKGAMESYRSNLALYYVEAKKALSVFDMLNNQFDLLGQGVLSENVQATVDKAAQASGLGLTVEQMNALYEVWGQLSQKMGDLNEEAKWKIREFQYDLDRDIEKIESDHLERLGDLYDDYLQNLQDLKDSYAQKEIDAYEDLQWDLADIDADYQDKLAQMAEDAHNDLLDRERGFQRDLEQLRENALFDLEEAVRVGDARQARSILRKYAFDREQMLKDQEIQRLEDARSDEIARQKAEREYLQRKARRIKDYNDRILEYRAMLERELAEEEAAYQKRIAEEEERKNEAIEDRRERYEEQLRDLDHQNQLEIEKLMYKLSVEYALEVAQVNLLRALREQDFRDYVSYEDAMLRAYKYYTDMRDAIAGTTGVTYPVTDDRAIPWYGRGGTFVARKPTVIGVGESGEEIVSVTPVADINRNITNTVSSSIFANVKESIGGNALIRIALEPGLRGTIIEDMLTKLDSIIEAAGRTE